MLIRAAGSCGDRRGPGAPDGAELVDRIRATIAHPVHAAALAVALFTGQSPDEVGAWPIHALADGAAVLRSAPLTSRADYTVPPAARPLLAAARTFEQLRGARSSG
ncbi:hypothetical protein [Micromonospora sp. NPDC049107]|uniref:hypothetical protein n=1 Tax=unclassified Micromonospora TaxID=2617518 RepID=UPI00340DC51F